MYCTITNEHSAAWLKPSLFQNFLSLSLTWYDFSDDLCYALTLLSLSHITPLWTQFLSTERNRGPRRLESVYFHLCLFPPCNSLLFWSASSKKSPLLRTSKLVCAGSRQKCLTLTCSHVMQTQRNPQLRCLSLFPAVMNISITPL